VNSTAILKVFSSLGRTSWKSKGWWWCCVFLCFLSKFKQTPNQVLIKPQASSYLCLEPPFWDRCETNTSGKTSMQSSAQFLHLHSILLRFINPFNKSLILYFWYCSRIWASRGELESQDPCSHGACILVKLMHNICI
jgi:hypothetical protein